MSKNKYVEYVFVYVVEGGGGYGTSGISDQCVKKRWTIQEMCWNNWLFGKILRPLLKIMQNKLQVE